MLERCRTVKCSRQTVSDGRIRYRISASSYLAVIVKFVAVHRSVMCYVLSMLQLCALKTCRQLVKDKNAYVILRELHKWEKNRVNVVAIENLVSVLICDEPESGMANLNEVVIPADVAAKLQAADEQLGDN